MRRICCLVLLTMLHAVGARANRSEELPTIDNPRHPDPDLQRFFGPKQMRIVETATRVDVLRINPKQTQVDNNRFPARALAGLPTVATRVRLPAELAEQIKQAVLSPRIYRFGIGKGCGGFRPGVVFRFWAAHSGPLDIYLCFNCNDLGILRSPQDLRVADVTAGRLNLLRVAAEALPQEQGLRHLYSDEQERAGNRLTGP